MRGLTDGERRIMEYVAVVDAPRIDVTEEDARRCFALHARRLLFYIVTPERKLLFSRTSLGLRVLHLDTLARRRDMVLA